MEENLFFEINDEGRYLRLFPSKIIYPDGKADHDLIGVNIRAKSRGLEANIDGVFMLGDLNYLHDQLLELSNNLSHSFEFQSLESDLDLNVKGDGVGNISIDVSIHEDFIHNSQLIFTLYLDQSYLDNMIKQLYRTIKSFEPIG